MSDNWTVFPFGMMKIFYNDVVVIAMQPMKKLQINELYNLTGKFMLHVQHINK